MKRLFLTMLMLLCIGHLMIVKAVTSTADSNQALVSILPETSDISIYRWALTDNTYMPQPFLSVRRSRISFGHFVAPVVPGIPSGPFLGHLLKGR